jgi:hypothetical protein
VAVFATVVSPAAVRCVKPTIAPAKREPLVTRGPTEIVVGLYWQGGAFIVGCPQEPHGPDAGTVTVSAGRRVVARETLAHAGKLFALRVAPASYTITAENSTLGGGGGGQLRARVKVASGRTVRRDLFLDVP